MPPPSTAFAAIQHRISVYQHYFLTWAADNRETLRLIISLGIFLVKMLSITKPCLPETAREIFWYPLMALAALELALLAKIGWRATAIFAAGHGAVIWWAMTLGGGLCAGNNFGRPWQWGDEIDGELVRS